MLIHLKAGTDLETLKHNVRLLAKAGWSKAKAINTVLSLAGFRPPDFLPPAKSSPDVR